MPETQTTGKLVDKMNIHPVKRRSLIRKPEIIEKLSIYFVKTYIIYVLADVDLYHRKLLKIATVSINVLGENKCNDKRYINKRYCIVEIIIILNDCVIWQFKDCENKRTSI